MAQIELAPEGIEYEPMDTGIEMAPEGVSFEPLTGEAPAPPPVTGEQLMADLMPGMGAGEPAPTPAAAGPEEQGFLSALGQDIQAGFGDITKYLAAESARMFERDWEESARQLGQDPDSMTPEQRAAAKEDWARRQQQFAKDYQQLQEYFPERSKRKPANVLEEAARAVVPSMATGSLSPLGIYAQIAGNELEQIMKDNPDIDPQRALELARQSSAVQTAIEFGVGIGQLGTIFKGAKPFLRKLTGKAAKEGEKKVAGFLSKVMRSAPARIIHVAGGEGIEEGTQGIVQAWRQAAAENPDADPFSDKILNRTTEIMSDPKWQSDTMRQMAIGALGGGMMGGPAIALGSAAKMIGGEDKGPAGDQGAPGQAPEVERYVPPPRPEAPEQTIARINQAVDNATAKLTGRPAPTAQPAPAAPAAPPPGGPAPPPGPVTAGATPIDQQALDEAEAQQMVARLQQALGAPQQAAPAAPAMPGATAEPVVSVSQPEAPPAVSREQELVARIQEALGVPQAAETTAEPAQAAPEDVAQAMLEQVVGPPQLTESERLAQAMSQAEQEQIPASESGETGMRTPALPGPEAVAPGPVPAAGRGVGEKSGKQAPMAAPPSVPEVSGPTEGAEGAPAEKRTWRDKIKARNQITVEHAGMKPAVIKKGDTVYEMVDGEPVKTTVKTVDAEAGKINGRPAKMFFPTKKEAVVSRETPESEVQPTLPVSGETQAGPEAVQAAQAATDEFGVSMEHLRPVGQKQTEAGTIYQFEVTEGENKGNQITVRINEDGTVGSTGMTEVVAEAAGSEAAQPAGSPRVSPTQAATPEVVTKIRETGSKSQAETYAPEKVVSKALDDAVKAGSIGKQEADVIKGMLSEFPEAWQERLEVRVSEQEFAPTKEQKSAAGTGRMKGARIAATAELKRLDEASRDAKTVITMFKGSDVVDFVHEIGEFVYKRLLTNTEKQLITRLKAKDPNAKKSQYKNEWFSDQFEKWWLQRKPMSKGLTKIFTRILKSIKNIYKRIRGDVAPELQVILEDIIVNGRDIRDQNIFFTNNDMVRMYIVGADPTANKIAEQGFSGNTKTVMSWDPSSICPKQQNFIDWISKQVEENGLNWEDLASVDVIAGLWDAALADGIDVPCSYCYVEEGRRKALAAHEAGKTQSGVRYTQAKQVYKQVPYKDRIMKLPQSKIDELNRSGGLRLFSFSDYVRVSHRTEVDKVLRDAAKRGLSIKAVTKNPEFVEDFGDTGITINLSIDKTRHGMPWDTAAKLKRKYPNVKVRAIALNMKEFKEYAELSYGGFEQFVDVITPYHHENTSEPVPEGFEDMTWDKVGGKRMNAYAQTVPGLLERVCCQEGGKCFNPKTKTQCPTNCGTKAGNLTIPQMTDIRYRQPDSIKNRLAKNPGRRPTYEDKKTWPKDFPNVITHTTLKKLREHPKYEAAKAGDVGAAVAVVKDLSKESKIKALAKKHPKAILVAAHAVEAAGNNAIPETLATHIADTTGLQIDRNIVQANSPQRTAKNSEERLVHRPIFDGPVHKGAEYILIDDAVGSGGTFAELRNFIETNGGKVVDTMALTAGLFSNKLSIRSETVAALNKKFGRKNLADFLKEIELAKGPEYLTEKEGRFILRQQSLDGLRDRIPAQRQEASPKESSGIAKTPTSVTTSTSTPASTTLYSGLAAIPTKVLGGVASGAAVGMAFGGPVGAAVGGGVGALLEMTGTPIWDKYITKRIPDAMEKIPVVGRATKAARRALDVSYRGDLPGTPGYLREWRRTRLAVQRANEYAIDLGNRLSAMPEDAQLRIGEAIRGEMNINDLAPQERALARESVDILQELGLRAVEAGLLNEESYFKNFGRYMPRLYTSKEYQGLLTKYGLKKPTRLDLSRFKRRKDIPKEVREEMGEILTPGYPVAKGIIQIARDIEIAHMFQKISENPDWAFKEDPHPDIVDATKKAISDLKKTGFSLQDAVDVVRQYSPDLDITIRKTKSGRNVVDVKNVGSAPADWKQLPENKRLGALSKAWVHPEIFTDIEEAVRPPAEWEKYWNKALGAWKFGKVVLSPKTHMRNMISNSLLMHMGGLPLYRQAPYLVEAAKEIRKKGKIWKEAKDQGLMASTFTGAELRELYDQVDSQMAGVRAGSVADTVTAFGKVTQALRKGANTAAKAYELEEQWGKLAMYIYGRRNLGLNEEAAAEYANKWLFDYGDLTRFQRKYRKSPLGAPFATFTFKAIPRVMETWVKYPHRMLLPMMIINGLGYAAARYFDDDEDKTKAKKKLAPEWMQGSFLGIPNFQRVPVTDDYGREYYVNLTYILPWGDIGEAGGFGPIPGGLMPFSQPFVKEAWQQFGNYDLFWDEKIVKDKDLAGMTPTQKMVESVKLRAAHFLQTMSPTPVIDIDKMWAAYKGIAGQDYRGRFRPRSVVLADVIAGVKMYPVDYDEQMLRKMSEWMPGNGKRARELMSEYKTLYTKMAALANKNADTTAIEKQISDLRDRMAYLSVEMMKWSNTYTQAMGPRKKPRTGSWMQQLRGEKKTQ